ncbi:uncharacterized protein BDV14DRAFT_200816 [Aspergillus stella-maris]|uniref:uncharacterized protein n=1 Tax=Aspergillus stella-maris TaxID=1810926 RepID=UPI003CCDC810
MANNIDGHIHGHMPGFIEKAFGNIQYTHPDARSEIQEAAEECTCHRYLPPATTPDHFFQYISYYVFQERYNAQWPWLGIYLGGVHLFVIRPTTAMNQDDERPYWGRVQAIGYFYDGHGDSQSYRRGLVRLSRSAQQVFANQHTRLFLHGFYMHGTTAEAWVFDQPGLYCSETLDLSVVEDFKRLLSIVLSYPYMSDRDLGHLGVIQADKAGNYVVVDQPNEKIYIEIPPIASRPGLVGSGTTCYAARKDSDSPRADYVVKFQWLPAGERSHDKMLKLAVERGAWGAVWLQYRTQKHSTSSPRRGFQWDKGRRFLCNKDAEIKEEQHPKQEYTEEAEPKLNPKTYGLAQHTEGTTVVYRNRILTRTVYTPVGRPLHTFRSISELLRAFRDANILHRDISPWNILIPDQGPELNENAGTENEHGEGNEESFISVSRPQGFLINLDSAIDLTAEFKQHKDFNTPMPGKNPFPPLPS